MPISSGPRPILVRILCLVVLLLLVASNDVVSKLLLGRGYLSVWLDRGTLILLTFTLISLVWGDLNSQMPDLVSADPGRYASSCMLVMAGIFLAVANSAALPFVSAKTKQSRLSRLRFSIDVIFSAVVLAAVCLVALVWLLTIAPGMYFITLFAGAPARMGLWVREPGVHLLRPFGATLVRTSVGKDQIPIHEIFEPTLAGKPVTVTAAFSVILVWMVKLVQLFV